MKVKLLLKKLFFPGLDIGLRSRVKKISPKLLVGTIDTLDIGCGNGAFTLAAVNKKNNVIAIDGDLEKLNRSIAYFDYLGVNKNKYKFILHDIYLLKNLNKKFDQIFLFETLEHLKNDVKVVELIASMLKDNGIIHISTPALNRKPYYDEYITDEEDGGHIRLGYDIHQLESMCIKQGLKVVDSFSFFGKVSLLRL